MKRMPPEKSSFERRCILRVPDSSILSVKRRDKYHVSYRTISLSRLVPRNYRVTYSYRCLSLIQYVPKDETSLAGREEEEGLKDVPGSFDFFERGSTSRQGKAKRGKSNPGQSSLVDAAVRPERKG